MTLDPIAHTLSEVVDQLRGGIRRERTVGELIGNVAWWLDAQSGVPVRASTWALTDSEIARIDSNRLVEAPYLAAVGYLVELGVLPSSPSMVDAAKKIARRAPRTMERTGFADDSLVLAGLYLLHRRLSLDVTVLRDEASRTLASPEATSSVAVLLALIDFDLVEKCRPFAATDTIDLAVALSLPASDNRVRPRLFPTIEIDGARSKLMTAACAGEVFPTAALERAFASIALTRAIEASTSRPRVRQQPNDDDGTIDVAVMVALKEEFRDLFPWLTNAVPVESEGHQYYRARCGLDNSYAIISSFIGEMGPSPAAVASSRLLQRWQPRYIVLLGLAGSVAKEVDLGDVVVATQVDS